MAKDKRKRRKQLPALSKPLQDLAKFGVYTFTDSLPGTPQERNRRVLGILQSWIDGLHQRDTAAPRWLLELRTYYQSGVDLDAEICIPSPDTLRAMFHRMFSGMNEADREGAILAVCLLAADFYREAGMPVPEWLREVARDPLDPR